ncbi:MAG: leucyl/phenylalanyl-tRNA--protein transferase, partial [Halospina sp.]
MSALPWLDTRAHWFPDPETALEEPDGLLAIGGDLHPERLIRAYSLGIFPWFSDDQPILWWSPNPRCVLFPPNVHIARSLRR